MNSILDAHEVESIKTDRDVRVRLAQENHYWFFSLYLSEYMQFPFAPFHHEMFRMTENMSERISAIVAFRGSAKSTIMTLSYPIWAITGKFKKKFVLICSQTQQQARLHLTNIKRELENNQLLKDDIGPFEEFSDEWAANSIVLKNYDARIVVASVDQSIRGMRHGKYRPDLVICDDVEDLNSAKTKDGREKTLSWLSSEILPIGDGDTKIVIVGNLLHEDCLLMRLKQGFDRKALTGRILTVPLLSEDMQIAWSGKYPTMDAIEQQKMSIGNEAAWYREYLLQIIADADRVVQRDWIQYYDVLPPTSGHGHAFKYAAIGVDLAISEKSSADFTAMVGALIFGSGEKTSIYILPNQVNTRMDFPRTVDTIKVYSETLLIDHPAKVFVESVGYQEALVQWLENIGVDVYSVKIHGADKRTRLSISTPLIKSGNILFPRVGTERLIEQMINLGIEKHDDLADAFSTLIQEVMERSRRERKTRIFSMTGSELYSHVMGHR